jgi:hypothetical protein
LKKQSDTVLAFQEQSTKNTGHITAKLEEIGNTTREMTTICRRPSPKKAAAPTWKSSW